MGATEYVQPSREQLNPLKDSECGTTGGRAGRRCEAAVLAVEGFLRVGGRRRMTVEDAVLRGSAGQMGGDCAYLVSTVMLADIR